MKWIFFLCALSALCGAYGVEVPEPTAVAIRYYKTGNVIWIVEQLLSLVVPLLIMALGISARLRNVAQKITGIFFWKTAIYALLFSLLVAIVNFPLSYYSGFLRPHWYGLATQSFESWLLFFTKKTLLTTAILMLLLWIPYGIIKKSKKRWWLYLALMAIPFSLFFQLIQPIWIDPLFNRFGPMQNKELEQKILALAQCAGIEGGRVYEVDKSLETKALNAYVIGFGRTKRIVLWDTTIKKMTEKELLFVMGHEMGHYVLNHLWMGFIADSAMNFLILYLTFLTVGHLIRKYSKRFSCSHVEDVASFPLIVFAFTLYSLLLSPAFNLFSQRLEHEADRFGLEITQDNHAAAMAFVKLQSENLAYPRPGPVFMLFRAHHPSIADRIEFLNSYAPWKSGQPLKYAKLIRCKKNDPQ